MKIDLFRLTLLGAFSGAEAYLGEMTAAIPVAYASALADLKESFESQGQDYEDYDCACQEADAVFDLHVPRILRYSFLIYLHSLVEQTLNDIAKEVRKRKSLALKHNDLVGSAIERTQKYLTKVAGYSVVDLKGWSLLRDLASVRDVLVHRGGRLGEDPVERRRLKQIAHRSMGTLSASRSWDDPDSTLELDTQYCLLAVRTAHSFFSELLSLTRADIGTV